MHTTRIIVVLMTLVWLPVAWSATFNVDTTNDTVDANIGDGSCADAAGDCSVRAAVAEANASASADQIIVPAGNYLVNQGVIRFTFTAAGGIADFIGDGPGTTVFDGGGVFAVNFFKVDAGAALNLSGVTLQNTYAAECANTQGGALNSGGNVSLVNVVIRNNRSCGAGAGINLTGGSLNMTNVAILNNVADNEGGGGIFMSGTPTVNMQNVIIAANQAPDHGGGIGARGFPAPGNPTLSLNGVTIHNNTTFNICCNFSGFPGIDMQNTGTVTLAHTILADNVRISEFGNVQFNCTASNSTWINDGNNLFSGDSCDPAVFDGDSSNINNTSAFVGFPFDFGNGIPIPVLGSLSPAVDAGGTCASIVDAAGTVRPQDGDADLVSICDIGAHELVQPSGSADLSVQVDGPSTIAEGADVSFTLVVSNAGPDDAAQVAVSSVFPSPQFTVDWTCTGTGGATCRASGQNTLSDLASIPAGESVTYISVAVTNDFPLETDFEQSLWASPVDRFDPIPGDNIDTLPVGIGVPNSPPVAASDIYSLNEDTVLVVDDADGTQTGADPSDDGVLANDSDADMDALSVTTTGTFIATGIGGTVVMSSDGTFTYTPPGDVSGMDGFDYTVSDGEDTAVATVSLSVAAVNDPPSFQVGADLVFDGGTSGGQAIANWATGFDPGPMEGGQSIDDYLVSIDDDPAGVLVSADVSNTGTLDLDLTGNAGTATVSVVVRDDGGTANGGQDTSMAQSFFVSVGTNANIRVVITQCDTRSAVGFDHNYLLRVFNRGPDVANGITLELMLPPDTAFVDSLPAAPDCIGSGGLVTCEVGALAAFESRDVAVVFMLELAASGVLVGDALVAAVEPDLSMGDNAASIATEVVDDLVVIEGFESCGGF